MGKLFCLLGKSASGKDSIYDILKKDSHLELNPVVLYTTRPMRDGEVEGESYFFISADRMEQYGKQNRIIESRTYQTVFGPWTYATIDDGKLDIEHADYLMVGALPAYHKLKQYFGENNVVPLYIEVEDGERLTRALQREKSQTHPRYEEMCRRFLADQVDFSEENLSAEGICVRYRNTCLEECVRQLVQVIRESKKCGKQECNE